MIDTKTKFIDASRLKPSTRREKRVKNVKCGIKTKHTPDQNSPQNVRKGGGGGGGGENRKQNKNILKYLKVNLSSV